MSPRKSAPELPGADNKKPSVKKMPKISKFAEDSEPAMPKGESTIKIIKDTDERDLQTATADANQELQSMTGQLEVSDDEVAAENPTDAQQAVTEDEIGDLNDDSIQPISDELTEPLEEDARGTIDDTVGTDESVDTTNAYAPEPDSEQPIAEDGLPDDDLTSRAVDEIVAKEGDAVLEAEDKKLAAEIEPTAPIKRPGKLRAWIKKIWSNPKARWGFIAGVSVIVLTAALVPHSRYFLLNTMQVRSTLSVRVIDGNTLQPLKNVSVLAGGAAAQTDSDGVASLSEVRLGNTKLIIEKRAFAKIEQNITVGWGSNPLGEFRAEAVGTQYTFLVSDYLSDRPIPRAEAASGDGNASSNEEGKLVLTLDTAELDDAAQISVEITAEGRRSETVTLTVNNRETQSVQMVPARKHTFVSKRSGNYDVYTIDIDGRNERKVVGGTGLERDDIVLVPHGSIEVAALVSTRENVRNGSGYLLSTLYVIDTKSGNYVKVDQSEKVQIVGWSDEGRLVYVKVAAGASGTDPKRHRLMSFNNEDFSDVKELASSNSFNDVVMARGKVYYAPSNIFQENTSPGVFVIDADGANKRTVLNKEAFVLQRSSYEELDFNAGENWFNYTLGSKDPARQVQAPASQTSKLFADNPRTVLSLWAEDRDGKGVLLSYNRTDKKDKVLVSYGGLKLPIYWLTEEIAIFRVRDSRETADYVININGGEARRVGDVTDTAGISRWFYY